MPGVLVVPNLRFGGTGVGFLGGFDDLLRRYDWNIGLSPVWGMQAKSNRDRSDQEDLQ